MEPPRRQLDSSTAWSEPTRTVPLSRCITPHSSCASGTRNFRHDGRRTSTSEADRGDQRGGSLDGGEGYRPVLVVVLIDDGDTGSFQVLVEDDGAVGERAGPELHG